jgi:3-dehydroquinate dehydratase / shikimate dehydrogenase
MLCVVVKGPSYTDAMKQIQQASKDADLVELRLDFFDSLDEVQLKRLRSLFSKPMIFTLRSKDQGGVFRGAEKDRLKKIEWLAELKPDYLDIEYNVPIEFITKLKSQHPNTKLIVSFHDFEKTPGNLEEIWTHLKAIPASFHKVATMAASSVDALKQIWLFKNSTSNVISVSMGEAGQFSRVLNPIMGGKLSYACLEEEMSTAAGQIPITLLKDVYRYHSLNNKTLIFALIGSPISQSLGHFVHNEVMSHFGINAVYVKIPVKQEDLSTFFSWARKLGIQGLSVTMPLKEQVLSYIDQVDPYAQKIGAVNTIVNCDGILTGYNTDAQGALDAIEEKIKVRGKKIVILGAGGAAKAIAFEARHRGGNLVILNRNSERAKDLGLQLNCLSGGLESFSDHSDYTILVNSTPNDMPIDSKWLTPGSFVMDIRTKPKLTALLKQAIEKGCYPIYGYQMFIHQAIQQWKLWQKDKIDLDIVKTIITRQVEEHL